jgi:hypothetical protein
VTVTHRHKDLKIDGSGFTVKHAGTGKTVAVFNDPGDARAYLAGLDGLELLRGLYLVADSATRAAVGSVLAEAGFETPDVGPEPAAEAPKTPKPRGKKNG